MVKYCSIMKRVQFFPEQTILFTQVEREREELQPNQQTSTLRFTAATCSRCELLSCSSAGSRVDCSKISSIPNIQENRRASFIALPNILFTSK